MIRTPDTTRSFTKPTTTSSSFRQYVYLSLFILAASFCAALYSFYASGFIPSLHDEFSYLFQARTFLLGRLFNPPHPEHLFFDAYHIINEGIYASKYFPGYALTLMPFEFFKVPYLNPVFFYACQLLLTFQIARELFNIKTAWLATFLTAISPQIVMQTSFLMSHIVSAVFLLYFFFGFLKWKKNQHVGWALSAGVSWGMAFLTRPLTAVAFAIPVTVMILVSLRRVGVGQIIRALLVWGVPVLITTAVYTGYNKALTGSYLKSPFDYYAQIHAPYHRYGFDMWTKHADEANGPRVNKTFNEHYHNHKLADGLLIAAVRLEAFLAWILGSFGLGLFALTAVLLDAFRRKGWLLPLLAVWTALQLAYIPHWYPGTLTFGANYLYESSALFLVALSYILIFCANSLRMPHPRLYASLFLCILLFNSFNFLTENMAFVQHGKSWVRWANIVLAKNQVHHAVVFVRYGKQHNLDWDIINNTPNLDGNIVYAIDRGAENERLKPYFPDRTFYLLDTERQTISRLNF